MNKKPPKPSLLRRLPGVDHVLELAKTDPGLAKAPKSVLVRCTRTHIENLRKAILENPDGFSEERLGDASILDGLKPLVEDLLRPNLGRTINATGVVVHTNLGRSLLCAEAIDHLTAIAERYSNLEFDLSTGKRGSRSSWVSCSPCGCQLSQSF